MFNNLGKVESFVIGTCGLLAGICYVIIFIVKEIIVYPIKKIFKKN